MISVLLLWGLIRSRRISFNRMAGHRFPLTLWGHVAQIRAHRRSTVYVQGDTAKTEDLAHKIAQIDLERSIYRRNARWKVKFLLWSLPRGFSRACPQAASLPVK